MAKPVDLWKRMLSFFSFGKASGNCHGGGNSVGSRGLRKIGIVGSPNVGKSVVFNGLTGSHAIVSNYPGTTVDVSRGKAVIGGEQFEVVDTPGMYSLISITGEERVGKMILLEEKLAAVLHVADARNLERMLPFTLQLIEAGFPVILDLNMIDEAEAAGLEINTDRLEEELGIPVIATAATTGRGMATLRKRIADYLGKREAQEALS